MYDPRLGRFTQTDPILGNRPTDHYAYASNNPISRIDPLGLQDHTMYLGEDGRWGTRTTSPVEKDIATLRELRRQAGGEDYWLERQERWRLWAIEEAKRGNPDPLKAYDQNYAGELVLALQPARMLENLAAARTVMNPAEPLSVMRPGERARSGAGVKLTPEPEEAAASNTAGFRVRPPNPTHPPNADVTKAMGSMKIEPHTDCSEIARDLYKAAGNQGRILKITKPGGLKLVEGGAVEGDFTYHQYYTDGRYVYDPRFSTKPIPAGDYDRMMKGLNRGATVEDVTGKYAPVPKPN